MAAILKFLWGLVLVLGVAHGLQAQEKLEREYKVSKEVVPGNAVDFIDRVSGRERIKWYREYNHDGMFYEAKLRKDKIRYSIKFDSAGNLYDVEELIRFSRIAPATQAAIRDILDNKFKRWKVTKAQVQWTGDEKILQRYILERAIPFTFKPVFELVLRGKRAGDAGYYEIVFSHDGALLKERRYAEYNLDNLIF